VPQGTASPGSRYSARSAFAGLSRAVARPGQNATALAMRITAGTMTSTGQVGVMAASGMPRPRELLLGAATAHGQSAPAKYPQRPSRATMSMPPPNIA
jgi:hypothetical protein